MITHPALGNRAAMLHRSARSGSLRYSRVLEHRHI
jgi:hypothetical protein